MKHLLNTLQVAKHLTRELAAQRFARFAHGASKSTTWSIWFPCVCLIALLFVLYGDAAWAADATVHGWTASFTLFDTLDGEFKTQSDSWFATILGLVRPTFLILATIEICWAAAIWAIEKDNLNSLAVEVIKKIMFIGFFFALLQFAPAWIPTIASSFVFVGRTATGQDPITTDGIIATGLAIIGYIWSLAPTGFFEVLGRLGQIIIAGFVTLGVIICYVIIAAQYFVLLIESYILFAAGAIFLGLGSSSWTKDYVSKYLNYAITVGVRLLVLILIMALMLGAVENSSEQFTFDYGPLFSMLAIAILQAILAVRAPEMASALMNGGVGLSAGSAMSAASSATGGFKSVAMAPANAAMKGAASAAQGMGNVAKAVSAGRELAKAGGATGAAATLGGLGAAMSATARAVPGKLMDAIKRSGQVGGGAGRGQNPGVFDRAKHSLQARAQAGAGAKEAVAGGSAGSGSSLGGKSTGGHAGGSQGSSEPSVSNVSSSDISSTPGSAAPIGSSGSSESLAAAPAQSHVSDGFSSTSSSSASTNSAAAPSFSPGASSSASTSASAQSDVKSSTNKLRKAAAARPTFVKRPDKPGK